MKPLCPGRYYCTAWASRLSMPDKQHSPSPVSTAGSLM